MSAKKFFLVMALVCGLIALLLLGKAWQANENVGDSLGKNDGTVTTTEESTTSGAIAKAKETLSQDPSFILLKKEARQFGLYLLPWEKKIYGQFRDRLFTNENLASALKTARQEGIIVVLEHKFQINTQTVDINIDASDEEIVEFLVSSTPEAKARNAAFKRLRNEARQFGMSLMPWEKNAYKQIRNRLFANDKLAAAFKAAADAGLWVELERDFQIRTSGVHINVDASDKEIIEFLLGK